MGGVAENGVAGTGRTRDPARKQRILDAAAALIAEQGFHAVAMSDIGAASGITGSAIYRHFESKSAVLVALFDNVIDVLLENAAAIVEHTADDREALALLVRGQVRFAIDDRPLLQIYLREIHSLPEEDRRRLRRKQRRYVEEWVHLVVELRPDLIDTEARALVHAAIGAIQSILHHESGLPEQRLDTLTTTAAVAVLGVEGLPGPVARPAAGS
jgi:AcrR family transcriptional regulator